MSSGMRGNMIFNQQMFFKQFEGFEMVVIIFERHYPMATVTPEGRRFRRHTWPRLLSRPREGDGLRDRYILKGVQPNTE